MSEQTTQRTVEEADVLAHLRWLVEQGRGWADDRTHTSFMAVRDALLQAARMPSEQEVVEVLAAHPDGALTNGCCKCGAYVSQDYARRWDALRTHRAERVAALWGGGERG